MWKHLLVGVFLFAGTSAAFADDDELAPPPSDESVTATDMQPIPASAKESDGYDFSWLDPDKKIYVVQNRKYTKAEHFELSVAGGLSFGEPYRTNYVVMPRGTYYFSESWGFSFLGAMSSITENKNFQNLKTVTAVIPTVRDVPNWYGLSVVWVPFYAKINMFNTILYVDWQFELGGAYVNSEVDLNTTSAGSPRVQKDNYSGIYWGTGQKFFLSKSWAVRFDFTGLYYSPEITRNGVLIEDKEVEETYYFTLGLSVTL